MILIISSFELIEAASILRPQQAAAQRALAKLHSKNRCVLVSSPELQREQVGSIYGILLCRLALVGIALAPILQISNLRRSGNLAFHTFDQCVWD